MGRTKFRYQKPYETIYRVGIEIGTQPECQFTTIQAAINAAIADGHTSNDNPAYIEIYSGTYTESPFLAPGIHLIGKGTRNASQDFNGGTNVLIQGQLNYTVNNANTYFQNRVVVQDLKVEALGAAVVYQGTGDSHLIFDNCTITKASGGGIAAIVECNPTGSINLLDFYDTVISSQTNNDIGMEASAGFIFFWGSYCGIKNDFLTGNNLDTGIQITGNPYIQINTQDGFNAPFNQVIDFQNTGTVVFNGANIVNGLPGGCIGSFNATGSMVLNNSNFQLADDTSKLALDNGIPGVIIDRGGNAFSDDGNGTAFNQVDDGFTVFSPQSNGSLRRDDASNMIYVRGGRGYATIQEGIDAAVATGSRYNVLIAPGSYTEDLTINANQVKLMPSIPSDGFDVVPVVEVIGNHSISAVQSFIQGISFSQADETVALFNITGAAALFRNCNISGAGVAITTHAIVCNNGDFVNFDKCKFRHDFLDGGFGLFSVTGCTLEIKNNSGSQINDIFVPNLNDATAIIYVDATGSVVLDGIRLAGTGSDPIMASLVAGSNFIMDFCDIEINGTTTAVMFNFTTGGFTESQNCNINVSGGAAPRLGEDGGASGVFRYGSLSITGTQDIDATLTIVAFPSAVNPI